jgi:hypothetical protein
VQFNGLQKTGILLLCIALPFIPSAIAAEAPTDGSTATTVVEPPVGIEKYRGATDLSEAELIDLLHLAGFEGKSLRLAWAVVMRESRGHVSSHNKQTSTGDNSYGLFQINMMGSLGEDRREKFGIKSNAELLDPVVNAQAAFYMTAKGTNFGSWGLGPDAYDGTPSESAVTDWLSKYPSK